ncbi:LysR family transcriptional regulator, partial [Streptomyces sp. CHD11]|nr:LysR family transcriptional regulator [Streptomyces sp. CHD11]
MRSSELSARHQSFSAAASEFSVTPAAVGQMIRTLERWLGTALFHRSISGKVRLIATEASEAALPDIQ